MSWQNKVAIVTGGSSGLGKSIARAFAARGASVVIAARGADALRAAAEQLRPAGNVVPIVADITSDESVASLVGQTIERFGKLDVLVNNAGRSGRRAVLDTTPAEFAEMMELNLLGTVRCTRAAAPHLLASRGHLVNIGSLASKVGTRWIGAYPASKHAVAAYSQQLRLELGPQGLHVLLACPGPIARDEPRQRYEEQLEGLPESARRPGGGAKTKAIDPDWLAERILRACEKRQPEIVIPGKARLLFAAAQLFPRFGDWVLKRMT